MDWDSLNFETLYCTVVEGVLAFEGFGTFWFQTFL